MQKIIRFKHALKFGTIMRLSSLVILLSATFSIVTASNTGYGQVELDHRTSVSYKGIPLARALEDLQRQTGLPLAYRASQLPENATVTYSANKKVRDILRDLLAPYRLFYEVRDGFVVFRELPEGQDMTTAYRMQDVEIRGQVTDTLGNPLVGVSVVLKGTPSVGTTTDLNGRYILLVPPQSVLTFSYVGYRPHEEAVGSRQVVNVMLVPTEAGLDEVVVVGFGTQKRISVVGAQSSITPQKLQLPAANLTNVLGGRLAGVVSVQRSGEPGFDDADIWVRGISTFSSGLSKPLVLVDGTPRAMANVDPEDIASFTILKDASATAVYGVRGANGVILITTKSGQAGKPRINFRYYEGRTRFTKLPEFADGVTYMRMSNEALTNRGATPLYSEERIQATANQSDPYLYPDVDWVKAIYADWGSQRRANLNVNGGSDRVTYYVGASFLDEQGLYNTDAQVNYNHQTFFKRYNLTTNLKLEATNTTKVDVGIQGYLANANYPGTGQGDIWADIWMMTPIIHPVRYENGYVPDQRAGSLSNPYASLTETGYANQWRNQLFSNLRVTQQLPFLTDGLSVTAMFSFDVYNYTSMRRTKRPDTWLAIGRDADGSMRYEQTHEGDRFLSFSRNSEGERTIYFESALNYNRSFGKHDVTGMLLFNKSDRLNSQASNFINSLPYRFLGFSGRTTYGYDSRYFLELNFGYNGSENFTPKRRYGFFPSVGLGWAISEERFFEPLSDVFDLLKLRVSHGKVGNSQIDGDRRFAYITTIDTKTGYNFGRERNNSWDGLNVGEYGVDVTWETALKSNLGIDVYAWNNSLNLQFDVFKERREGIFLRRGNVPAYVGLQSLPFGNLGIIENEGLDGSFNYSKQLNDNWSINVLGNLTYTRNNIVENDQPTPTYPWLDQRGRKVGQRFGLIALGLFESEDEIRNGPLHPGTVRPGDIRFQDVNGDGKIDDFDRVPIGYGSIPELVYGFGFSVGYKGLTLSTLFQGVGNVDIYMSGEGVHPFSVSMSRGNLLSNITDRWTIDDPRQDVFYPRLSDGSPNGNFLQSTWWLKNGRYIRLKEVQLTYAFPKTWINRIGLSQANIFFAGTNLITWSPFRFWDVELGDGRASRYPSTAVMSLGFNVSF